MARAIALAWLALFLAYAGWITYESYTVIPNPPCDWWKFVTPPQEPPGLGKPQFALITGIAVMLATYFLFAHSKKKRTKLFFAFTIPLLTVVVPLIGVVDMEIHGGCIQLGGPEISRYNSFESLVVLLIFGAPFYVFIAGVVSAFMFASVYFTRRREES